MPKESRHLKRTTREWRNSKSVFHAWSDSPFSGSFLTLRENKKFEITTSGMVQTFTAGSWTNIQDTLYLKFYDDSLTPVKIEKVIIDKKTSTLLWEGDSTPVQMRLRIMQNELN